MSIVCKFRCMDVTRTHDGIRIYRFRPVMSGSEENKSFWKFTPSGEFTLKTQKNVEAPYIPGDTYLLHLQDLGTGVVPSTEDDSTRGWKLFEVTQVENQISLKFGLKWDTSRSVIQSGDLSLSTSNEKAWEHFYPVREKVGSRWMLCIDAASDSPTDSQ